MEEYSKKLSGQLSPAFSDELLAPTLKDGDPGSGKPPWRLQSQIWVALLGGTIAIATIAFLNGRRLGLNKAKQTRIVIIGAVSLALVVAAVVVFSQIEVEEMWRPGENGFRFVTRVIALIASLAFNQIQKSGNRVYTYFRGNEFDSLWQAGIAAIVVLGFVQNVLIYIVELIISGG